MCDKLYLNQGYCNPRIDECLITLIDNINSETNLKTLASCCGHKVYPATIIVKDKTTGIIFEYFSKIQVSEKKRNRYYKKDSEGYYFVPEIVVFQNTVIS